MTKLTLRAGGVAAAAASTAMMFAAAAFAAAEQGGRPITVQMTGAAEAPGPGDPDGTGVASFRINPGQKQVCYELTAQNIGAPTAAHIHRAPAGQAGPVVVPLDTPTGGKSKNCATVTPDRGDDAEPRRLLCERPQRRVPAGRDPRAAGQGRRGQGSTRKVSGRDERPPACAGAQSKMSKMSKPFLRFL
jgi:hypothetical protein